MAGAAAGLEHLRALELAHRRTAQVVVVAAAVLTAVVAAAVVVAASTRSQLHVLPMAV